MAAGVELLHNLFSDITTPPDLYFRFRNKDDLKAARIETAMRTKKYPEQPQTTQRLKDLDRE